MEHLGQFSISTSSLSGSVFGQRLQSMNVRNLANTGYSVGRYLVNRIALLGRVPTQPFQLLLTATAAHLPAKLKSEHSQVYDRFRASGKLNGLGGQDWNSESLLFVACAFYLSYWVFSVVTEVKSVATCSYIEDNRHRELSARTSQSRTKNRDIFSS